MLSVSTVVHVAKEECIGNNSWNMQFAIAQDQRLTSNMPIFAMGHVGPIKRRDGRYIADVLVAPPRSYAQVAPHALIIDFLTPLLAGDMGYIASLVYDRSAEMVRHAFRECAITLQTEFPPADICYLDSLLMDNRQTLTLDSDARLPGIIVLRLHPNAITPDEIYAATILGSMKVGIDA